MEFGEPLIIRGYLVSYKRKDIEEPMFLKVNAFSDQEALNVAKKYVADNFEDCEVIGIQTSYKFGFTGVLI